MKNLLKKFTFVAVLVVACFAIVSCKDSDEQEESAYEPKEYMSLEDYKSYIKYDLDDVVANLGTLSSSVASAVAADKASGEEAIDAATSIAEAKAAFEAAKAAIANEIPYANGVYSYSGTSTKTDILGVVEAYAVRNGLTGITLFENGSYVMYNPRITLGTENYIVGYGFGTLAEGSITADLDSETKTEWKRYYHTVNASDPGTANYLNDQGSEVADFYSYFAASYYEVFMNETKDGYTWTPLLAKADPVAVDPDEDGNAKTWNIEIRVGSELKYSTNSAIASRAAFNNREVAAEDYITAFKLLLTQSNGLYRGSELANSSTGAIEGAKAYYDSTAEVSMKDADFSGVGIKIVEDGDKTYLQVTYTQSLSMFYARYYISSSLYQPIPQDFLDLVTVENYCGFNADKTESPVDNSLSLGSYTLERWDSGEQIVYKKNPNYVYADSKYSIEGVHIKVLTAASSDNTATFKEFLAGNIDAASIPSDYLSEYSSDPRTHKTTGSSCFKLNVNALDEDTWEYYFGTDGVITQTAVKDYWEVKPCLSNSHFVKALSLSIDRVSFALARGSVASVDYLSSNYMSDPENGISYSVTDQHKSAVSYLTEGTDGYGYSLEMAREYFRMALSELEAEGAYQAGTKENPTVISLEIAWMYSYQETSYHNDVKQFLETAFNDESVSGGLYKLEVNFWVGNSWSDVYYNKMMIGQFDIAFGSISGDTQNPLNFMTCLSADQELSGGFTLNWSFNTNDPDADILVYDGVRWSFDALLTAGNDVAIVVNGAKESAFTTELVSQVTGEDGSVTSTIEIVPTVPEETTVNVYEVVVCWYEKYYETGSSSDYAEAAVEFEVEEVKDDAGNTVKYIITIVEDADTVAEWYGNMGVDVYYTYDIAGNTGKTYSSVYGYHGEE